MPSSSASAHMSGSEKESTRGSAPQSARSSMIGSRFDLQRRLEQSSQEGHGSVEALWRNAKLEMMGEPYKPQAHDAWQDRPIVVMRDYVLWVISDVSNLRSRLRSLEDHEMRQSVRELAVALTYLPEFIDTIERRARALHREIQRYVEENPLTEWDMKASPELTLEYRWLTDVTHFVADRLDELTVAAEEVPLQAKHRSRTSSRTKVPPPTIAMSSQPHTRGPEETSNSRAWQWAQAQKSRKVQRQRVTVAADDAGARTAVLSTTGSHKANSAALVAISIFGASIAWTSLFSAVRGSLPLLAWASCAFVSAAVAATGMVIILDSDQLDLERDMTARRVVRAFNALAGLAVLAGIVLLSVAVMAPDVIDDDKRTQSDKASMKAAGSCTIILVVLFTAVAFQVRLKPYKKSGYVV